MLSQLSPDDYEVLDRILEAADRALAPQRFGGNQALGFNVGPLADHTNLKATAAKPAACIAPFIGKEAQCSEMSCVRHPAEAAAWRAQAAASTVPCVTEGSVHCGAPMLAGLGPSGCLASRHNGEPSNAKPICSTASSSGNSPKSPAAKRPNLSSDPYPAWGSLPVGLIQHAQQPPSGPPQHQQPPQLPPQQPGQVETKPKSWVHEQPVPKSGHEHVIRYGGWVDHGAPHAGCQAPQGAGHRSQATPADMHPRPQPIAVAPSCAMLRQQPVISEQQQVWRSEPLQLGYWSSSPGVGQQGYGEACEPWQQQQLNEQQSRAYQPPQNQPQPQCWPTHTQQPPQQPMPCQQQAVQQRSQPDRQQAFQEQQQFVSQDALPAVQPLPPQLPQQQHQQAPCVQAPLTKVPSQRAYAAGSACSGQGWQQSSGPRPITHQRPLATPAAQPQDPTHPHNKQQHRAEPPALPCEQRYYNQQTCVLGQARPHSAQHQLQQPQQQEGIRPPNQQQQQRQPGGGLQPCRQPTHQQQPCIPQVRQQQTRTQANGPQHRKPMFVPPPPPAALLGISRLQCQRPPACQQVASSAQAAGATVQRQAASNPLAGSETVPAAALQGESEVRAAVASTPEAPCAPTVAATLQQRVDSHTLAQAEHQQQRQQQVPCSDSRLSKSNTREHQSHNQQAQPSHQLGAEIRNHCHQMQYQPPSSQQHQPPWQQPPTYQVLEPQQPQHERQQQGLWGCNPGNPPYHSYPSTRASDQPVQPGWPPQQLQQRPQQPQQPQPHYEPRRHPQEPQQHPQQLYAPQQHPAWSGTAVTGSLEPQQTAMHGHMPPPVSRNQVQAAVQQVQYVAPDAPKLPQPLQPLQQGSVRTTPPTSGAIDPTTAIAAGPGSNAGDAVTRAAACTAVIEAEFQASNSSCNSGGGRGSTSGNTRDVAACACVAAAVPSMGTAGAAAYSPLGSTLGGLGSGASEGSLAATVADRNAAAAAGPVADDLTVVLNSGTGCGEAPKRRLPASLSGAGVSGVSASNGGPSAAAAAAVAKSGGPSGGGNGSGGAARLPSIAEVRAAKAAAAAAGGGGVAVRRAQLHILQFGGSIRYATTAVEVEWLCGQVLDARPATVGLDMEWRPQYVAGSACNPTALVQICYHAAAATARGAATELDSDGGRYCCCLLLHVIHSGVTPKLRQLLEAEEPRKVGVNITGDAQKLRHDYGVDMKGMVELDSVANERVLQQIENVTVNTEYRTRWSLAALVETSLRRHLPKPNSIRCGNWEKRPLDAGQQRYAALDAYAGLAVWAALTRLPYRRKPPPPPATAAAPEASSANPSGVVPAAAAPAPALLPTPVFVGAAAAGLLPCSGATAADAGASNGVAPGSASPKDDG